MKIWKKMNIIHFIKEENQKLSSFEKSIEKI